MTSHNSKAKGHLPSENRQRETSSSSLFVIAVSVLYPPAMIVHSFVGGTALQLGTTLAGASVFFAMILKKTRTSAEKKFTIILTALLLLFWGWYGALWTEMRSYGAILVMLSCMGIAWATLEFDLRKYVYEYPFLIFLFATIGLISTGTDQHEFNEIMAAGSRNVYSAILLALAIGYLFSKKISGERTSILLGIALVATSLFLYSRTGLALSFALFFPFLLGSGLTAKFRPLLLACLPVLILITVFFDVGEFLTRNSNFEKGLDSERFAIWHSYLSEIDAFNLIFGYNTLDNDLITEFRGNPHSAYLRLHSYFGAGLFFLLFLSLLSAHYLIKERKWTFIFLSSCFFFRAAFDPIYFIWNFDYAFYPFVFYIFFKNYFPTDPRNTQKYHFSTTHPSKP